MTRGGLVRQAWSRSRSSASRRRRRAPPERGVHAGDPDPSSERRERPGAHAAAMHAEPALPREPVERVDEHATHGQQVADRGALGQGRSARTRTVSPRASPARAMGARHAVTRARIAIGGALSGATPGQRAQAFGLGGSSAHVSTSAAARPAAPGQGLGPASPVCPMSRGRRHDLGRGPAIPAEARSAARPGPLERM